MPGLKVCIFSGTPHSNYSFVLMARAYSFSSNGLISSTRNCMQLYLMSNGKGKKVLIFNQNRWLSPGLVGQ